MVSCFILQGMVKDRMESVILDEVRKLTKILGFRSKQSKNTKTFEKSVSAPQLKNSNIVEVDSALGDQGGNSYKEGYCEVKANDMKDGNSRKVQGDKEKSR